MEFNIVQIRLSNKDDGGRLLSFDHIWEVSCAGLLGRQDQCRTIIILIHGYNVGYSSGQKSYETFLDNLRKLLVVEGTSLKKSTFCEIFWPSDTAFAPLSVIDYSGALSKAKASVGVLFQILQKWFDHLPPDPDRKLYFVAHSMGTRLTLELLNQFPLRFPVRGIFLMAPAIPVDYVTMSALPPIPNLYSAICCNPIIQNKVIFHSDKDWVLRFGFPIFQPLAESGPYLSRGVVEAVGRFGNPANATWDLRLYTGLGHTSYWTDLNPPRWVGRLLDIPVKSDAPSSPLGESLIQTAGGVKPRHILVNSIPERKI